MFVNPLLLYCCLTIPSSIYIHITVPMIGNSSQLFEGRVTEVRYALSFFNRSTIPQRVTRTPGSYVGCASVAGDAGTVSRAAEAGTGAAVATWTCTLTQCSFPQPRRLLQVNHRDLNVLFKSASVNKHLARCFDERLPKYLFLYRRMIYNKTGSIKQKKLFTMKFMSLHCTIFFF